MLGPLIIRGAFGGCWRRFILAWDDLVMKEQPTRPMADSVDERDDEARLESLARRLLSTPPVPRDKLGGKGKPKEGGGDGTRSDIDTGRRHPK